MDGRDVAYVVKGIERNRIAGVRPDLHVPMHQVRGLFDLCKIMKELARNLDDVGHCEIRDDIVSERLLEDKSVFAQATDQDVIAGRARNSRVPRK